MNGRDLERLIDAIVTRRLHQLERRLQNSARRAVLDTVDDGPQQSELQARLMSAGDSEDPALAEIHDKIEHFQAYGLASSPPGGSELIVLRLGAAVDQQVVIASADRGSRPRVAGGEVVLYDAAGQRVGLRQGTIEIVPKDGNTVTIGTDAAGNVTIRSAGKVVIQGATVELGEGATQAVARVGDSVQVTIPAAAFLIAATGGGTLNPAPVVVTGTVTAGSSKIKAVG